MDTKTRPRLSEQQLFLLVTPDDYEEAPWMTMPEFQWRVVTLLASILESYARRHGLRWHVVGELKVTFPRPLSSRPLDVTPDLLVVEADAAPRVSWNIPAEGQPPALVLEVVTEESWKRDTAEKPAIYDEMGVQEYLVFAPLRHDQGPLLFGYQRDASGYFGPWPAIAENTLRSTVLGGLQVYVEDIPDDPVSPVLRVRDAQGHRLPTSEEEAAQAQQRAAEAEEEVRRLRALLEHDDRRP